MECAGIRDHAWPPCVPASALECSLNRLGTRVPEVHPLCELTRGDRDESLRELDLRFVVEIGTGEVRELRSLPLDGADESRVGVAVVEDEHARSEVEQDVPVNISHVAAPALLCNNWLGSSVGGGYHPLVTCDYPLRSRAGNRFYDVRTAFDPHRFRQSTTSQLYSNGIYLNNCGSSTRQAA